MTQLLTQLGDLPVCLASNFAHAKCAATRAVIDQLEELFTLRDVERVSRKRFMALLAAADDPAHPCVVMSMRADLDRLGGPQTLLAELSRGSFFLSAPDTDNLMRWYDLPKSLGTCSKTPRFRRDASIQGSRGALPLWLQFAASKCGDSRDRSREKYPAAVPMSPWWRRRRIFLDTPMAWWRRFLAPSQPLLRAVLTRPDARSTRDCGSARAARFRKIRSEIAHYRDHLRVLAGSRHDRCVGRLPVENVEIVHEALITEWPTLKRWLEDSPTLRGFLFEPRNASKQCVMQSRSGYCGAAISPTKRWGRATPMCWDLSSVERDVTAVADQQESRQTRRVKGRYAAR